MTKTSLDQFYTDTEVAKNCLSRLYEVVEILTERPSSAMMYIEPSAGTGAFFNLLPEDRRIGMDIEPKCPGVIAGDYLRPPYLQSPCSRKTTVVVGNPPYGYRGRTARAFINVAAYFADTIAFILPAGFKRHEMQKGLYLAMRLVHSEGLPRDIFRTADGRRYSANTVFQIWTFLPGMTDLRQRKARPTEHPDYSCYHYQVQRHFDEGDTAGRVSDFAVSANFKSGFNQAPVGKWEIDRNQDWLFFYYDDESVGERLRAIDFKELAGRDATSIPFLSKGKVVEEYERLYGDSTSRTHD